MSRKPPAPILVLVLGLFTACRAKPAPPNVPLLVEQLKNGNAEVSGRASLDLIRLGEPAAPALAEMLADPEPRLRALAAQTLWGMGAKGKDAVPALASALADAETHVRVTAAMALENMGPAGADAVPALSRALGDRDGQVRQWAARALGSIGPAARAAIPALARAAKVDSTREAAEEAIRKIRGQ